MEGKLWCVFLGTALVPFMLSGEIVYQENFTGTGASLVGQAPDMAVDNNVWIGDNLLDNGEWGADTMGEAAYAAMWLPIDLQPETRYTITLDLNIPESADWYWTALGFTEWDPPMGVGFNVHPDKASCWMLARERGAAVAFPGAGTDNSAWANEESFFTAGDKTVMRIILETGTEVTDTEVSMYINGLQLDIDDSSDSLSRAGVDARNFAYVGIGRATPTHSMNQFTVEASPVGGYGTWAAYPILDAAGNVDTGSWLGMVNVAAQPYIWSYTLGTFLYVEEETVDADGGWAYIFN